MTPSPEGDHAEPPMSAPSSPWRIDDLAHRAGVTVDTVRYYQRMKRQRVYPFTVSWDQARHPHGPAASGDVRLVLRPVLGLTSRAATRRAVATSR